MFSVVFVLANSVTSAWAVPLNSKIFPAAVSIKILNDSE